ncbi:MAG TPA: winged helix-turn-helix transcriptional regulator [Phycisphaerales bacterium]
MSEPPETSEPIVPPRHLLDLFGRRWAVPIMAELARAQGSKFVTLHHRLEASPTAVRQSLDHLITLGWAMRNPGYGHPLRPEYVLTETGQRLAPSCLTLDDAIARLRLQEVAFRRWSLPALHVIAAGDQPARFSGVAAGLGRVTDRALAMTLKDMQGHELIDRRVRDTYPPTPDYLVGARGKPLVPVLVELAGSFS